ncbi:SDR family NAD(P)-dependent oxidoreductase [Herbiconiux sp. P17]|uniref:SDR family NAD(P)-dependent oxidoreductase n=1 Tax=Herbiconiux wuyangfengii TaxID=3342794 RepID=UPI0035B75FBD
MDHSLQKQGRSTMSTSLQGQTALITGSTSGIGRAVALHLAGQGARVIISGRDEERGGAVARDISMMGATVDFIPADLSDLASVRELADGALNISGGKIDILVNNAAAAPTGPTVDMTEAQFDLVYSTNVKAPFFLVARLAPLMAERGGGSIVNITTIAAQHALAGMSIYGSSKAALVLLTKSWALEFGGSGVRVNAVNPGPILTPATVPMGEGLKALSDGTAASRVGTVDEIADAVAFLVSDSASYIYGTVLSVDGGRSAI